MMKLLIIIIFINCGYILSQSISKKYEKAMQAFNEGQHAEASILFSEFFESYNLVDEKYAAAKYYQGKALLKLNRLNEATIILSYLSDNFHWTNFRKHALFELGLIYFQLGKFQQSRNRLTQLLDSYPESEYTGSVLYWIGETYAEENNLEDAILFLESSIRDVNRNKFVDYSIYSLANIYEKIGDYDNAISYYDRLLTYHPDSKFYTNSILRLGNCYFKLKDYQNAIIELSNPKLENVNDSIKVEIIYLLANSYFRIEDYEKSEKKFIELISDFPNSHYHKDANYGLAWSYFQQKKYSDAFKIFDNLSSGNDSLSVKSFYWKGEVKRYMMKIDEAISIFKLFIDKYPNESLTQDAYFSLGLCYIAKGNSELASKFLLSANNPKNNEIRAKALTSLGEIELNKQAYRIALNYFNQAEKIPDISNKLKLRILLGVAISKYWLKDYHSSLKNLIEIEKIDRNFESQKVNYYYAENYFSLKNYNEALLRFENAFGQDENINELSLYGKSYCLFNIGEYNRAAESFSDFVKNFKKSKYYSDAYLRIADSYFGSRNYLAASKIYEEIFTMGSTKLDNVYTRYQYAESLFKSGKSSQAISEYMKIVDQFPKSEYAQASLFTVAWIFFQKAEYFDAISKYNQLITKYPDSDLIPIAFNAIADSYYNMAKYDSAIANYKKVINDYPKSSTVFDAVNGVQLSYVAMGNINDAIIFIDDFILKNPELNFSDKIYFKKGEIYYSSGNYVQARESFRNFVIRYPKSNLLVEAYYWMGKCEQNLNLNTEAILNFQNVFNLFRTSEFAASAILEIGLIYRKIGQFQKALDNYNLGINELPNSSKIPEILFNKGLVLLEMKNSTDAYNNFQYIINNFPRNIFAEKSKLELALIELSYKRYDKAFELFSALAKNRTDDIGAKAQYYLGVLYFEQKKYSQAIDEFNRVKNFFSRYEQWVINSTLYIGDCYAELNDKRKAAESYRLILTKYKGTQFAKIAQEKLRKLK